MKKEWWQKYKQVQRHVMEDVACPKHEVEKHLERGKKVFADGCGFYKLFWVFVLGAFYGDVIEILFCRVTGGEWMSRSSLVFGQFSIVWGLGCFLLTLFLHRMINMEDRYIFIVGAVLGGVFEYMCSVFTEKMFGCVFWDYSAMRFNLNGRINLLFCFFWGIMAIVWLKMIYPWMSKGIEKLPIRFGKILTWVLVVFFALDISLSATCLYRMKTRENGIEAKNWMEELVDEHFSTEWIEERYKNIKMVEPAKEVLEVNLGAPVMQEEE